MNWLIYFQSWFNSNQLSWKQYGIDAVISSPTENINKGSIRADFDTDEYVARVTLWESGECDMEILNVDSGGVRFWKHYQFMNKEEAEKAVTEFVERLCHS